MPVVGDPSVALVLLMVPVRFRVPPEPSMVPDKFAEA